VFGKVAGMDLEKGLPHLVSWENGFALGRITKFAPRFLRLALRFHPAEGSRGRWAVWCHRLIGVKQDKVEFVWCLELPMRTEVAARVIVAEIHAHLEHKRTVANANAKSAPQLSLTESQLRFLAKSYPRTVALFRAARRQADTEEKPDSGDELKQAFVEETYACSQVLLESVKDKDRLRRMARRFKRIAAGKRKPDPVEFELIVGCYPKNYCSMKLSQLQQAVATAVGYKPTVEALRKKWTRLRLPSRRRRGRPKKESSIRTEGLSSLSVEIETLSIRVVTCRSPLRNNTKIGFERDVFARANPAN
jgi:hypothetical protein